MNIILPIRKVNKINVYFRWKRFPVNQRGCGLGPQTVWAYYHTESAPPRYLNDFSAIL